MQSTPSRSDTPVLVACLCAQWCDTCNAYQSVFAQVQARFTDIRFLWVDIEDDAELVDPIEVDNFPTLLIAGPDRVHFFGTITPHPETLQRLIDSHRDQGSHDISPGSALSELARRLWQHL